MPASQCLASFQLRLPHQGILTLPDGAGVGIECRSGSVWVTLDHDPRDIVLSAGERFEGDGHRRMLVSALSPALVAVCGARPAALPQPAGAPPARCTTPGLAPA